MNSSKAPLRINCSMDDQHSPVGARILGEMRGEMVVAAERAPLPERFSAVPHPDQPAMIICDEETGRSTVVGLYAYRAARQALSELFSDAPVLRDVQWKYDEAAETVTISPEWANVDRPITGGIQLPLREGNDADLRLGARLVAAIKAGAAIEEPVLMRDCNGQTYISAPFKVIGRRLNADLRRLGF